MGLFEGRKVVIATKHKKELVIAPLLEKNLGVTCFVPDDFDSDALGTFSGEIKRKENEKLYNKKIFYNIRCPDIRTIVNYE